MPSLRSSIAPSCEWLISGGYAAPAGVAFLQDTENVGCLHTGPDIRVFQRTGSINAARTYTEVSQRLARDLHHQLIAPMLRCVSSETPWHLASPIIANGCTQIVSMTPCLPCGRRECPREAGRVLAELRHDPSEPAGRTLARAPTSRS
jgi:hypothetical protein